MVCRQCNRTFRCEVRKRDQHRNHWGHRSHQSLVERGEGDPAGSSWSHIIVTAGEICRTVSSIPKYFFLKKNILKKHAEKYGIATAFWMLLTVLECWNVQILPGSQTVCGAQMWSVLYTRHSTFPEDMLMIQCHLDSATSIVIIDYISIDYKYFS